MNKQSLSPRAGGAIGVLCAAVLTAALGCSAALPAVAAADATVGAAPTPSTQPGLPDGRVYEQVSPQNKNGNEVSNEETTGGQYGIARADGNAVLFRGSGPMGESVSGIDEYFTAEKSPTGWVTRSATSKPTTPPAQTAGPGTSPPVPTPDFSHFLIHALASYVSPAAALGSFNLFFAGADPLLEPTWISRPTAAEINPALGEGPLRYNTIAGAPTNGGTVYFAYEGTLIPQDASRKPYTHREPLAASAGGPGASGFYEWTPSGGLEPADVLPDGSLSPYGAVPASLSSADGLEHDYSAPARLNNEVSLDGSHAFFLSPDPTFCEGISTCGGAASQLYVRETAADGTQRTLLVSEDALLEKSNGLPAAAPDGPLMVENNHYLERENAPNTTTVYASPDGSQAFFESVDPLTEEAREAANNAFPKAYDFNTSTDTLTYLPNVTDGQGGVAQIEASTSDGSRMFFVKAASGEHIENQPTDLEMWTAGAHGGTVTPIVELPQSSRESRGGVATARVAVTRVSADGSVLVFDTNSSIPGFNNGGYYQVYRYDVASNTLDCLSCPPAGVAPTGNAVLSWFDEREYEVDSNRGISADGSRVFFDTPDPLVPRDTNGKRDVYEWENGTLYLISSGTSPVDSYYLDNSESGGDVFFSTRDGLAVGDTDNAYDLYDARVPQPGDNPPLGAAPCEGSACQGPPSAAVPSALGASATFDGLGNPPAQSEAPPPAVVKQTPKAKGCKKGFVKKKNKCIRTKGKKKAKRASRDRRVNR